MLEEGAIVYVTVLKKYGVILRRFETCAGDAGYEVKIYNGNWYFASGDILSEGTRYHGY